MNQIFSTRHLLERDSSKIACQDYSFIHFTGLYNAADDKRNDNFKK